MRNCLLKSFAAITACCVMLTLASPASAQWRGRDRWGSFSRASIDRLIRQAENDSDRFVRVFDRALDNSRLDQTMREERLNERASALEQQLNVVRQEFERGGFNSVRPEVQNALDLARRINTVMSNRRFDYVAERQWTMLRSDLNRLARAFNVQPLG